VVTAVVPMTLGASRRGRGVLLAAIALVQCYATRTQDGCAALSYHATMAECRVLAEDYRRFDSKALARAGIPVVVSYQLCCDQQMTPTAYIASKGGARRRRMRWQSILRRTASTSTRSRPAQRSPVLRARAIPNSPQSTARDRRGDPSRDVLTQETECSPQLARLTASHG